MGRVRMGGALCILMPWGTCFLDPRQEMRVLSHFPGRSLSLILGNGLPLRRTKNKGQRTKMKKKFMRALRAALATMGRNEALSMGYHRRVTLQIVS